MNKKIYFTDIRGNKRNIAVGDVVVCYTGYPQDTYKKTDPQVISGKRKTGDPKPRYTLVVEIIDNTHFIGISVTNTKKRTIDKFACNSIVHPISNTFIPYTFVFSMMRQHDINNPKDFVDKCHANDQLDNKNNMLTLLFSNSRYLSERKKIVI